MSKIFKLIRAYSRIMWGFCPACNSDAPAIDKCMVCMRSREYPPAKVMKARWMRRFKRRLRLGLI